MVIDKINTVDFQGISDQIKTTGKSADNFLAGSRMSQIMANLESSTAAFEKSMTGMENIISAGSLEGTLTEARQSLVEARALISEVKDGQSNEAHRHCRDGETTDGFVSQEHRRIGR